MPNEIFAKCPRKLTSRGEKHATTFELVDDMYAVHRPHSEPEIVVGVPAVEAQSSGIGPVYASQPSGGKAIPTGRVFVRFKSRIKAVDRDADIRKAGFEIAETVSYAPEAVWVRSSSGDIGESLASINKLEKLPDVEKVEPQMLMKRVSR